MVRALSIKKMCSPGRAQRANTDNAILQSACKRIVALKACDAEKISNYSGSIQVGLQQEIPKWGSERGMGRNSCRHLLPRDQQCHFQGSRGTEHPVKRHGCHAPLHMDRPCTGSKKRCNRSNINCWNQPCIGPTVEGAHE